MTNPSESSLRPQSPRPRAASPWWGAARARLWLSPFLLAVAACGGDTGSAPAEDAPVGRYGDFTTEGVVGSPPWDGGVAETEERDASMPQERDCRGPALRIRYRTRTVPFGETCKPEEQERTCRAGTWSRWQGDAAHEDCVVDPPQPCDAVQHELHEYRIRYASESVAIGETCEFERQVRTCKEGMFTAWSGTFAATHCQAVETAYCGDGVLGGDEECDEGPSPSPACAYGETSCVVCNESCEQVAGVASFCGDRQLDEGAGEQCDEGPSPSAACAYGETSCVVCNESCEQVAGIASFCGDRQLDEGAGEQCDEGPSPSPACAYGETSCVVCNESCEQVAGIASFCGDRQLDEGAGEQCDEGPSPSPACAYGATSCVVCNPSCRQVAGVVSYCGDGLLDSGEDCDDGNRETETCEYGETSCEVCGANCDAVSGAVRYCGDGALDSSEGEECDGGPSPSAACPYGETSCVVCSASCREVAGSAAYCGDGQVDDDDGEECDDGPAPSAECPYGQTSCLVCNRSCREVAGSTSYCGDRQVDDEAGEECDLGGATDACDALCRCVPQLEICDGVDNDCNGSIDDVDEAGDGIRDCMSILVLGTPGARASADFQAWVAEQGSTSTRIHDTSPVPILAPADLAGYDVVILDWLQREYTAEESAALLAWVEAGGGLMSLSGYDGSVSRVRGNSLLASFGVQYTTALLTLAITNFAVHPLTTGLTDITFSGGHTIVDLPDGLGNTPVAFDGGGQALGVALERGDGRVFVWGDEWVTFDSEWTARPEIQQFWVNAFEWLDQN